MLHREIIEKLIEARRRQDFTTIIDACADNIVYETMATESHSPYQVQGTNKAQLLAILQAINRELEILEYTIIDVLSDGDRAASRHRIRYHNLTTGKKMDVKSAMFWTFENDKIVELLIHYDTAAFMVLRGDINI